MINETTFSNFSISGSIRAPAVSPLTDTVNINIPLAFSGVTNYRYFTGTYTPNNDTRSIISGLDFSTAPGFIMVVCDSQLNLDTYGSIGGLGVPLYQMGINKFSLLSLTNSNSRYITQVAIDGTTGGDSPPMLQNVPCNYTIIMWQGTLS